MIDTREEVVSAPSSQGRRRNAPMPGKRKAPRVSIPGKTLKIQRVFSDAKVKPFDQIEWDKRTAEITDDAGKVIFKQENVEVPKSWSLLATKVVVSKYFYGEQNTSGARDFGAATDPSHLPHDRGLGCARMAISARRTARFFTMN